MPEYLHPGVYVQEESSGAKPIEGVSTSTACFVGEAARGRPNHPTLVTSWSQFERTFGSLTQNKGKDMPLAVFHFFQNGGKRTYIIRVLGGSPALATATLTVSGLSIPIRAAGEGDWANNYTVKVVDNGDLGQSWLLRHPLVFCRGFPQDAGAPGKGLPWS